MEKLGLRATSTSRCTCRCATRTRPASRRSPTLRDGDDRRRSKASVARLPQSRSGRAASWWCACTTAATSWCCASCTSTRRTRRRSRPGARVRVRGEVRGGFFGREMVHPSVQGGRRRHAAGDRADAGLPEQRAAAAGLPAQGRRRRRWRARRWPSCCPPASCPPGLPSLREALQLPAPPAARREPGRARGPQPPGLAAPEVRGAAGAAAVAAAGQARARAAARAGAAGAAPAACTSAARGAAVSR